MVILGLFSRCCSCSFSSSPGATRSTVKNGCSGWGSLGLFLGYVASQAGWIVAEVGRQPWAIESCCRSTSPSTDLAAGTVQTTFFVFLVLFTTLLIAEVRIMLKQISIGPEEKHNDR